MIGSYRRIFSCHVGFRGSLDGEVLVTARVMCLNISFWVEVGERSAPSWTALDSGTDMGSWDALIWDSRRRGGDGFEGKSESEISSAGFWDSFCVFRGVRACDRGVSLSSSRFSTVFVYFDFVDLDLDFGFGEELPRLHFLGLPLGLLGEAPFWLEDTSETFAGLRLNSTGLLGGYDVPKANLCLPSQHFSNKKIISSLFLIGLKRYDAISFASWAIV